tara:strand:+ start:973 stop:1152 length:180 start_codon:yes stop_codon:yes gene_type:complete
MKHRGNMTFRNKLDVSTWALDQMNKYGIKHPSSYTQQELRELNPEVPYTDEDEKLTEID